MCPPPPEEGGAESTPTGHLHIREEESTLLFMIEGHERDA